jgi:hypothetical protein
MGFTSDEIDHKLLKKDVELLLALDDLHQEREIKKQAIAIAKALAGDFK